ncbi:hypothetical protein TWF481_006657 [Arthrobotrys musiformis]|uniref:F-box domain-containing protein n=1 Tax=Arthrobotrys musiformis TaxID=47236 RepID=A0AAV9WB74_9PEZI
MPTLDSLPVDVKFIILTSLSTVRSLKSLCRACPSYQTVFTTYQSLIESPVYLDEALGKYARESTWLARYAPQSHNLKNTSAVPLKPAYEYVAYPDPVPALEGPQTITRNNWLYIIPETAEFLAFVRQLSSSRATKEDTTEFEPYNGYPHLQTDEKQAAVSYHKVICGVFQRFVKQELEFLTPDPLEKQRIRNEPDVYFLATPDEEERIIRGLYRSFVGLQMSQIYQPASDRAGWGP